MKYSIICLVLLFSFLPLQGQHLSLVKKIELKQEISKAKGLLYAQMIPPARSSLYKITREYPESEFAIIADYYLAQIELLNEQYYHAGFFIDRAYAKLQDPRLPIHYKQEITNTAGVIYYRLGLYEKASQFLERTLTFSNVNLITRAQLYLSLIYYENNNQKKANYYYYSIQPKNLTKKDFEIYLYLNNFLGWKHVDTKKIGFRDPNISCVYAHSDELYIGLWHGGFIIYNYINDQYSFFYSPIIASEEIRAICSAKNSIWIGCNAGLTRYNKRDNSFENIEACKDLKITSLVAINDYLYIGTLQQGLFRYSMKNFTLENLISKGQVSTISAVDDRLLCAFYDGSLFEITKKEPRLLLNKRILRSPITSIAMSNEEICVTTFGNGIFLLDKNYKIIRHFSTENTPELKNDYFLATTQKNAQFFCGSLGNGLFYIENQHIKEYPMSDLYNYKDIQSIVWYDRFMFIATLGEGVLIRTGFNENF